MATSWTSLSVPTTAKCDWEHNRKIRLFETQMLDDMCTEDYDATFGLNTEEMGDERPTWTQVTGPA